MIDDESHEPLSAAGEVFFNYLNTSAVKDLQAKRLAHSRREYAAALENARAGRVTLEKDITPEKSSGGLAAIIRRVIRR